MDHINPQETSGPAHLMRLAIEAWCEEKGIYSIQLAPPFTKLQVELKINGFEMSFIDAADRFYAQMELDLQRRAQKLFEARWTQWLEQMGEDGTRLFDALQKTGKELGNLRGKLRADGDDE